MNKLLSCGNEHCPSWSKHGKRKKHLTLNCIAFSEVRTHSTKYWKCVTVLSLWNRMTVTDTVNDHLLNQPLFNYPMYIRLGTLVILLINAVFRSNWLLNWVLSTWVPMLDLYWSLLARVHFPPRTFRRSCLGTRVTTRRTRSVSACSRPRNLSPSSRSDGCCLLVTSVPFVVPFSRFPTPPPSCSVISSSV